MRTIYTLFFYLLLPFVLLRLGFKAFRNPAYRAYWYERIGIKLRSVQPHSLWIHAVSVGESLAIIPLIKILQKKYPQHTFLVTNETPTGAARIHAELGDSVMQLYAPYDVPCIVKRFLAATQPQLLILVETELWPNYLALCKTANIPVVLLNARLSASSMRGYQRIAGLARTMMNNLSYVAAQTQEDGLRFQQLGLASERIQITGSLKFDRPLPEDLRTRAHTLRQRWGCDRLVWIAASTHESEEELILQAFSTAQKKLPTLLLVLVPRHPERCIRVKNICLRHNKRVVLHSQYQTHTSRIDIIIGDTMGELLIWYAASDIAFIGGSLLNKGGQNPLEPAAVGISIITGPYTYNFQAIQSALQANGAALEVHTASELSQTIIKLSQSPQERAQMGRAAKEFVAENKGALQKQINLLKSFIPK